jgi:hypothetical protein
VARCSLTRGSVITAIVYIDECACVRAVAVTVSHGHWKKKKAHFIKTQQTQYERIAMIVPVVVVGVLLAAYALYYYFVCCAHWSISTAKSAGSRSFSAFAIKNKALPSLFKRYMPHLLLIDGNIHTVVGAMYNAAGNKGELHLLWPISNVFVSATQTAQTPLN